MDTFGRIFRVSLYGESHGRGVGVVVDGVPAGLNVSSDDFLKDLDRRKGGLKGTTSRVEKDIPEFLSGIFNHKSTGSSVNIFFKNRDKRSEDYLIHKDIPRPGHADLTAVQKFNGHNDFRGGGMFSGRMTVGLVAAGVIAKKILSGIEINAELVEAGGERNIEKAVKGVEGSGNSIGGIVECRINGLFPGVGEPFFDSVESLISHAVFSIPGIKGVEFGAGFESAKMKGLDMNDPITDISGKTITNNSGGINGGITNGNEIIFRVAVKPASGISLEQESINIKTGKKEKFSVSGRHDPCFALRVPVIVEAVTAIVFADLIILERINSTG